MSPDSTRTPCAASAASRSSWHDALARPHPLHVPGARHVQEDAPAHHAVAKHLHRVDGGAFARGDQVGRATVVELALPEVVWRGVDVGNRIAVEDHADELGGPATLEDALVAIMVASFAGVDHEAHALHGGLRGDLGAPGAGAGDGDAVLH